MGDADIANMLPRDDELDEALAEVDEEMDRVFSFINVLHARTSYAMSQMAIMQKFRQSFRAFSIFVVPVILTVLILYATTAWVTLGSTPKVGLEMLIMILMCISLMAGLPLYACTLWDVGFTEGKETSLIAQSETRSGSALNLTMESDLTLDDIEDSLSTLYLFRGLSRARLHYTSNYSRSDPVVRDEEMVQEDNWESTNSSEGFNVVVDEMPAVINNRNVKSAVQQIIDLDTDSDTNRKGVFQKEEDVLKFMLTDWLEDVTLKDDVAEASKGKQLEIGNAGPKPIRSKIAVEGIGNCKNAIHKHIVEIPRREQSFGL